MSIFKYYELDISISCIIFCSWNIVLHFPSYYLKISTLDNDTYKVMYTIGQYIAIMSSHPAIILFCNIRNTSFSYFIFATYGWLHRIIIYFRIKWPDTHISAIWIVFAIYDIPLYASYNSVLCLMIYNSR